MRTRLSFESEFEVRVGTIFCLETLDEDNHYVVVLGVLLKWMSMKTKLVM